MGAASRVTAEENREQRPVALVNEAMHGEVLDILRGLMPELAPYSNDQAFNVILNSPEITARSFQIFRANRAAFASLLRDAADQPVSNDNEPLSCGRSISQVVALVVQAVAKRYFRAKFGGKRVLPMAMREEAAPALLERLTALLRPMVKPKAMRRKRRPGDRLFQAMRDYLLYEWQLRLIPHYIALPLPLVQKLGPRLLDYREIADIQWMARNGKMLRKPGAAMEAQSYRPGDAPPSATAILALVNDKLQHRLAEDLSLSHRQLTAMILRCHETFPPDAFKALGDSAPQSAEANSFVAAAQLLGFGQRSDPELAGEFAARYLANLRSAV